MIRPSSMIASLCLFVCLSLCLVSSVLSVNISVADRAFHGWEPWTISANRVNNSALIIDAGTWVRLIHEGGHGPMPPHPPNSSVTVSPHSPTLGAFNLTAYGADLDLIAAGQFGHAWLIASTWDGRTSAYDNYLVYADLKSSVIKVNISLVTFSPKIGGAGWLEGLAVDSADSVYAVQGNNVWIFDNNSGKQTNYFALDGSAAPIVSIDIDSAGSLWILEDFNSTTQASRLMQYSSTGEPISTNALNFTDIKYQNYLIDLAVDSHGTVYIAAVDEARILTWSTTNSSRGRDIHLEHQPGHRGANYYFHPQIALVNDSTLMVAEWNLPTVEVISLNSDDPHHHDHDIGSTNPQFNAPYGIVAISEGRHGAGLIIGLPKNPVDQAVLVSAEDGSFEFSYGPPNNSSPTGYVTGFTADSLGTVYVSEQYYNFTSGEYQSIVNVFGLGHGSFARTLDVTATGAISFDDKTQQFWIADQNQSPYVLQAFTAKYGVRTKSIDLTGLVAEVFDLKTFRVDDNLFLVLADYGYQKLLALNESGAVAGTLALDTFYPFALSFDVAGFVYVAGATTSGSCLHVYAPSGDLAEILLPPAGWNRAYMFGVTVVGSTVYSTSHDFDSVLVWERPHHRPNHTNVAAGSWFAANEVRVATRSVNVIEQEAKIHQKVANSKPHRRVAASSRR